MTELYIDGIQAVLPKDFSVSVKVENSFFTKNGEYTYDVSLSLSNPVNAKLYKNINRLNAAPAIAKRTAVLVANNRVYCNGTEIITGWTEDTVSIQIASGNSELNYFINNDLLISALPMKESALPQRGDTNYVTKLYPEVDYCLAPVVNRTAGYCINQWALSKSTNETDYHLSGDDDYWYPQPYLCAYIKDVLVALGYDLQVNQLAETVFKDLFICHIEETCKWNEMLPGWKVKDFLEEIENLFNVVFVVDNRKKTARLMLQSSYYTGVSSVHVQQVKDVYEAEVEEDPDTDQHSDLNIKYNLPDNTYYRWRSLSESVLNKAKRDVIPVDYNSSLDWLKRLQAWFIDTAHKLKDTIYTDEKDGREYLYRGEHSGFTDYPLYYMLNEFRALERNDSTDDLELEMIPVELALYKVQWYSGGQAGADSKLLMPVIDKSDSTDDTDTEDETLVEMIENDTDTETSDESKGKIFLAFFCGLNNPMAIGGLKNVFPQPFTDEYILDVFNDYWLTNNNGASLRLPVLDKLFYQGGYALDFEKGIHIQSYDPNLYDVRRVFEIRNKRYVCKEIEYTLDANGRKGAWVGTFYPIKLNDTEADAKWILSDGKWRDGGVWMDNGRWLDS